MLKKNQKGFSVVELFIALVIIGIVLAVGWTVFQKHHKAKTDNVTSPAPAVTTVKKNVSDFCFQNIKAITCVDSSGKNPVKYMPPAASGGQGQLVPNKGDTQYAYTSDKFLLLNADLSVSKELTVPGNPSINPGTISWSHDNKSLFFEINKGGKNGDRQIYKYNLADQTLTQLSHGENATSPFETADGHVIYEQFFSDGAKSKWSPYIMNADGSNAKEFQVTVTEFASMSYDITTDTLYISDFGTNDKGKIYYATLPIWAKTGPKSINANVVSSGASVHRLNNTTLVWSYGSDPQTIIDEFINSDSGSIVNTYTNSGFGVPIGVLANVSKLQKQ